MDSSIEFVSVAPDFFCRALPGVKDYLEILRLISDDEFKKSGKGIRSLMIDFLVDVQAQVCTNKDLDHMSVYFPLPLLISRDRQEWIEKLSEVVFEIEYWKAHLSPPRHYQ